MTDQTYPFLGANDNSCLPSLVIMMEGVDQREKAEAAALKASKKPTHSEIIVSKLDDKLDVALLLFLLRAVLFWIVNSDLFDESRRARKESIAKSSSRFWKSLATYCGFSTRRRG